MAFLFHMIIGAFFSVVLLWFCRRAMFKSGKDFLLVVESIVVIFCIMQNWDTIAQLRIPTSLSPIAFTQPGAVALSNSSVASIKVVTPSPHPRSPQKQKVRPTLLRTTRAPSPSDTSATDKLVTGVEYMVGAGFLLVIILLVVFVSIVSRRHRRTPLSEIIEPRCLECGHNKPVKEYQYQRGRGRRPITGHICEGCASTLHATAV